LTIDTPEDFLGVITQLLATRKGRMEQLVNHGTGWIRMEWLVPARGLIGFPAQVLTHTPRARILHHLFQAYEPWFRRLRTRNTGSLVADRPGVATPFAMMNLQERGTLFVEPTTEVYEGMLVGENSRSDDMDVNITKEKKLTNMRASVSEETEKLIPPRKLSLEQALEFCRAGAARGAPGGGGRGGGPAAPPPPRRGAAPPPPRGRRPPPPQAPVLAGPAPPRSGQRDHCLGAPADARRPFPPPKRRS